MDGDGFFSCIIFWRIFWKVLKTSQEGQEDFQAGYWDGIVWNNIFNIVFYSVIFN